MTLILLQCRVKVIFSTHLTLGQITSFTTIEAEFRLHALIGQYLPNARPLTRLFRQHPFDQPPELARVPPLRYAPVRLVQDHLPQRVLVTLVDIGRLVCAAFIDDTAERPYVRFEVVVGIPEKFRRLVDISSAKGGWLDPGRVHLVD